MATIGHRFLVDELAKAAIVFGERLDRLAREVQMNLVLRRAHADDRFRGQQHLPAVEPPSDGHQRMAKA